ncbi:MAG: PocR ligand-binding domain-containing protein [Anaerolineae bacterium]
MAEMLTAKEMQELLQVDRSTIYRMAEARRLPAVKVGRQWRFPTDQVEYWLQKQTLAPTPITPPAPHADDDSLASLLPMACVQLIQDTFAEALEVMIVLTDIQGRPITEVSKPCGPYKIISEIPNALQKCIEDWAHMGEMLDLEPRFIRSHLGLLGTRGLVRVGTELKGMVVIGGIAPDDWPPSENQVAGMAAEFGVPPESFTPHITEVFYLSEDRKLLILTIVQRIANIIAHIVTERTSLIGKLDAIAQLITL